jgi:hypothetical protein
VQQHLIVLNEDVSKEVEHSQLMEARRRTCPPTSSPPEQVSSSSLLFKEIIS